MAFVTDGGADGADRVDEFNTHHPFGGGELDLTSEVVNVSDKGAQKNTSPLGGLRSHRLYHILGKVRVETGIGGHFGEVWV